MIHRIKTSKNKTKQIKNKHTKPTLQQPGSDPHHYHGLDLTYAKQTHSVTTFLLYLCKPQQLTTSTYIVSLNKFSLGCEKKFDPMYFISICARIWISYCYRASGLCGAIFQGSEIAGLNEFWLRNNYGLLTFLILPGKCSFNILKEISFSLCIAMNFSF